MGRTNVGGRPQMKDERSEGLKRRVKNGIIIKSNVRRDHAYKSAS